MILEVVSLHGTDSMRQNRSGDHLFRISLGKLRIKL